MRWPMWLQNLPGPWRNPYGAKGRPHNPDLHRLKNRQTAQLLRYKLLERDIERDSEIEQQYEQWHPYG
jgi:hypothetical protein